MAGQLKKQHFVPILSVVLIAGCSPGANRPSSSETSPANANATPSIAQNAPPASSRQLPAATQPAPGQPTLKPEEQPGAKAKTGANGNANISQPATGAISRAPKLIVPLTDIDFGRVAKGKSLTRNLVVKNAGRADLNIESVSPS